MDRRMHTLEMCEVESDDPDPSQQAFDLSRRSSGPAVVHTSNQSKDSKASVARRYVGELIQRVEYQGEQQHNPTFMM